MGAWGVGIYENDTASDWVDELETSGAAVIGSALQAVLADEGYLDAGLGCRALAAADVIGRLRVGASAGPGPDSVLAWVRAHPAEPSATLLSLAERAVDRVVGPGSELDELWAETDEHAAWRSTTRAVVGRLL